MTIAILQSPTLATLNLLVSLEEICNRAEGQKPTYRTEDLKPMEG